MYLGSSGMGKGGADAAKGVGHDGYWLLFALVSLGLKAHAVHPEAKTVNNINNRRFPARDELGTCRTGLVSPEYPEASTSGDQSEEMSSQGCTESLWNSRQRQGRHRCYRTDTPGQKLMIDSALCSLCLLLVTSCLLTCRELHDF